MAKQRCDACGKEEELSGGKACEKGQRTSSMIKRLLLGALLLGISLHPFALPGDARAVNRNVNIASDANDPFWVVSDTAGTNLGAPENVCLNDTSPLPCPGDAIKYGHVSPGVWPADLSPIPGAKWIWAPNITGQTSPAANAKFTFTHDFTLCNPLQDGIIYIAVDDSAEVYLNGSPTAVFTTNSNLLNSKTIPKSSLNKFEFPTFKKNTITIKAKNAYIDWCDPATTKGAKDNYQCNPAGMVFGTSFPDDEPSCTGSHGETLQHGQSEPCPQGQSGSAGYCACGTFYPFNTCVASPACTGYTFSGWSACGTNGQQTRNITGMTPAGCTGTPSVQPVLTQACTYVPPTCTYTYSGWGACQTNNTQTRTVVSSGPSGCTGTPVLSQHCTYVPPTVGAGDYCGSVQVGQIATCPNGTTCGPRITSRKHSVPWWCPFALWVPKECDAGENLQTTDWYCDPS